VLPPDVFARSADPEADAREVAGMLSGVALELRGIKFSDPSDNQVIPLSAGNLTVGMAPGDPFAAGRAVKRVDLRLDNGAYAVDFSVDEDGGLKIRRLYKDGRSVTAIAGDALKREIEADPLLWGSLTALAAVGTVAVAHEYVKRTGDPIRFEVLDTSVMRQGPWDLRVQAHAELTGNDRFMRGSGVGSTLAYHDGPLSARLGVEYRPDKNWEASASASYAVSRDVDVRAGASVSKDDYRVGISLEARF
jgi:hypothetical protein